MQDIYLIKAAWAAPFVEALAAAGAPIGAISKQAGMPLGAVRQGDSVIGERSLWRFIEYGSKWPGCEFLGYDSARRSRIAATGYIGTLRIRSAGCLEEILRQFIEDARSESSGANYRLVVGEEIAWFRRPAFFADSGGHWQAELFVIEMLIQLMRVCAEPGWLPHTIRICSCATERPVPPEWAPIRFEWGRPATEIGIPKKMLSLPPRPSSTLSADYRNRSEQTMQSRLNFAELVDRLIRDDDLGIDRAAEEVGISISTLKRRLHNLDTTFSAIVESRRHELARWKLTETDAPIAKVAKDLGYSHQSNFTRAFIRMSGMSPLAYRTQYEINGSVNEKNS